MANKSSIRWFMSGIEAMLMLVIWLHFAMGLFNPWEDFAHPAVFTVVATEGQHGFGLAHALLMIEYLSILLLCVAHPKGVLTAMLTAWPIMLLCGWVLLSVTWAQAPADAFNRAGHFLFMVLFSCYLASRFDPTELAAFMTRGFAILVLASLAVMALVPHLGLSGQGGGYASAWRGAFVTKNGLGAVMGFGAMVTGYSCVVRANRRAFSIATFLGCVFLLVMARSATALIAALAGALVAVTGGAIQSRQRAPVLPVFAFIGVGTTLLLLILWSVGLIDINLDQLTNAVGRTGNLTGRPEVWHAVIAAIRQRPLIGYGYAFWDAPSVARSNIWLALNWAPPHAHNNWLDAALQLGLIGAAITAFIWLTALRRALWLTVVRYGHGVVLFFSILTIVTVESMTETITFYPGIAALFWLVISYIYIARASRQRIVDRRSLANGHASTSARRTRVAAVPEVGV